MAERESNLYEQWSTSPKRQARRVVATGMGAVSTLGNDVPTFWKGLIDGRVGLEEHHPQFPTDIKVIGQVRINAVERLEANNLLKDSQEDRQIIKFMNSGIIHRSVQNTLVAEAEALKQARLLNKEGKIEPAVARRLGAMVGTALGGSHEIVHDQEDLSVKSRTNPRSILRLDPHRVNSVATWFFDIHGPSATIVAACTSGNASVVAGYRAIYSGDADIMIVGGTEAFAHQQVMIKNFEGLTALSKEAVPEKSLRAFDKNPTGTVLSEGTGIVILEAEEHAKKRGAPILAELAGLGDVSDGFDELKQDPNGYAFEEAIAITLERTGKPQDGIIEYIGHGGGTFDDRYELSAADRTFNRYGYGDYAASSIKQSIGHAWAGDAGLRNVAGIESLRNGILVPTLNSVNPLDIRAIVRNAARPENIGLVYIGNTGLGGSTIVVGWKLYS